MFTIGERLKEERIRLNISQSKLAEIGGIARQTQINYECDKRSPDSEYLAKIAKEGINIQYVICGAENTEETNLKRKNITDEVLNSVEIKLEEFERQIQDMKKIVSSVRTK